MDKGYLVLAQNSESGNYLEQAYALALSIKNTQKKINNFSVISDTPIEDVPASYLDVFDDYIEISGEDNQDSSWKIEKRWMYYGLSPYQETVVLDTDMIFTHDHSAWWDLLSFKDIAFTTKPIDFRGNEIYDNHYRKTFVKNNLPNLYSAFFYFKKCPAAEQLFDLTEFVVKNWETVFPEVLEAPYQNFLSMDLAFAISSRILGIEDEIHFHLPYPCFVHMKSFVQGVPKDMVSEDWTEHWSSELTNYGDVIVTNYIQYFPFHYHIKSWLTKDKIKLLREIYDSKFK